MVVGSIFKEGEKNGGGERWCRFVLLATKSKACTYNDMGHGNERQSILLCRSSILRSPLPQSSSHALPLRSVPSQSSDERRQGPET